MVLPELSGRDAATTVSVAASIRHYKNAEGDLFAGGGDGALKGVLKSAAAGHLHAREGDGLDIVCGKDLAELLGIIDGVELRAADERNAALHEIGVEAAAGIGAAIGSNEQIRAVKIRGLDRAAQSRGSRKQPAFSRSARP